MTDQVLNVAVIVGFVNAVSFFLPTQYQDSRIKVGLAFVGALFLTFVPVGPQISGIIDLVFSSSGVYKGLQIVGAIRK